ncbi:hypothetical protein [Pseudochelatococcus sp. G4_1912]|uniref:hypothetical protein n=1 Tax=Pseudochelatococcus sp. G4_1912 TaxID=3114288 RepID=UPI0039C71795
MSFASKSHAALISAVVLLGATAVDYRFGSGILLPISAQAADNVTVEDIVLEGEIISLEIPRAIVNGTSLTEAELTALFDAKSKKPLAERLSELTASSIIIPELTSTIVMGERTQVDTYYNVEMRDVIKGVIGKMTSARITSSTTVEEEDEETEIQSATYGQSSIEALDTVFAARLFTESDTSENRKTQQLYGPSSNNDIRLAIAPADEEEAGGFTVSIASTKSTGVSARLGRNPLSSILELADTAETDFEKLPVEKKRALLIAGADILSSFDIGETTVSNMVITDGAEDVSKSKYAVRIGSFVMRYIDQELKFAFDDLSFSNKAEKGKDDVASMKHFSIDGLSFKSTVSALVEASKSEFEKDKNPFEGTYPAPTGGRLVIEGVDVDADISSPPVEETKDGKDATTASLSPSTPERLTFSLKAFDTTLGGDVSNDITTFQTTLTDLHFPLTASLAEMDGLKELRNMGYADITLSSAFQGQWDKAKKEFTIDTLSFAGRDIGSIGASARLGNVSVSNDINVIFSALEKASLHGFTMTLENSGLFEHVVKQQAKEGAGTEDEIKQQYAALATVGIPAIIGDTPVARKLAAAVSRFASSPRKLSITATAKDPAGVPIKALDASNAEPSALLERFDITTTE